MLPRPFAPLTPILGLTITLTLLPSYLALPTAVQPVHDDIAIDSPGSSAVHWNHDQEVMSLVPVTQGRASMVEYIHVDGHDAKDDTNVDLPSEWYDSSRTHPTRAQHSRDVIIVRSRQ